MKTITKIILIMAILCLPFFLINCGSSEATSIPSSDESEGNDSPSAGQSTPASPTQPANSGESGTTDSSSTEVGSMTDSSQTPDAADQSVAVEETPISENLKLKVTIDELPESAQAGQSVSLTYSVTNLSETNANIRVEVRIHDETIDDVSYPGVHHSKRHFVRKELLQSFCTELHPCTTLQALDVGISAGETKSWTTEVVMPTDLNGNYHFVVRVMDSAGAKFYARDYETLSVIADNSAEENQSTTDEDDAENQSQDSTDDTAGEVEEETTDTEADENDQQDTDDDSQVDLEAGANLFLVSCAGCHGSDGTGASGPNLTTRIPGMTDADIEDQIRNGGSSMPAVGAGFTQDEMTNIIAFLRTL